MHTWRYEKATMPSSMAIAIETGIAKVNAAIAAPARTKARRISSVA